MEENIARNQEIIINQLKNTIEEYERNAQEQNRKISDLTKEVKDLRNLLKNYLNKNNSENEEESENSIKVNLINSKSCQNRKKINYNNGFSDNEIKSGINISEKNQIGIDYNLSDRYRRIFDNNNDFNTMSNTSNKKRYSNKYSQEKFTISTTIEEQNKFMEDINIRSSSLKQRPKKNYFDTEIKENKYNGAENFLSNDDKVNHFSARNIFGTKRKISDNNNNSKKKNILTCKKIKDPRNKEYFDYEGYEGFNCFPCERNVKKNKKEIDELNNELNQLLKNKSIMENNLNKLPGRIKSINGMRQKRELNGKIKMTENKINEIRFKIKKLMKG